MRATEGQPQDEGSRKAIRKANKDAQQQTDND